jgi:hypothetical protein
VVYIHDTGASGPVNPGESRGVAPTTTSIDRNRLLVGKPLVGKILILITSLIRELL